MRIPAIGQIVHYNCLDHEIRNNQKVAAAIITAVHSDDCINMRVILDCPPGEIGLWATSIQLAEEPGEAGHWEWLPAYTPPSKGG